MSTNSTISYYDETTDTIKGIYCHWDGYIEYLGLMLHQHYNTLEKVKELVSMGSASSIDENIGHKVDFYKRDEYKDQCIFYSRDRNEDLRIFEFEDYDDMLEQHGQEFNYLFIDGEWTWSAEYDSDSLETTLREKNLFNKNEY